MLDVLQPRRALVIPGLVVAAPLAYFLYREVQLRGSSDGVSRTLALGVGALVAGYLGAVALTALLDVASLASDSSLARLVFRPDDATLAVLAVLVLGAAGYLVATLLVEVPGLVETLATPVGFLLGLPLVLAWGGTVLVGKQVGREPPVRVQFGAVAAGIALSVVWTAAVATGVAAVAGWA